MRRGTTIMSRIWKLGDNINTDVIIPGRYNVTTDRAQLARHCLCEALPEFSQQVQAGGVFVTRSKPFAASVCQTAPRPASARRVAGALSPLFAPFIQRETAE